MKTAVFRKLFAFPVFGEAILKKFQETRLIAEPVSKTNLLTKVLSILERYLTCRRRCVLRGTECPGCEARARSVGSCRAVNEKVACGGERERESGGAGGEAAAAARAMQAASSSSASSRNDPARSALSIRSACGGVFLSFFQCVIVIFFYVTKH